MTPDQIPKELTDILDERASKQHRMEGPVISCLAEILTKHREQVLVEASEKLADMSKKLSDKDRHGISSGLSLGAVKLIMMSNE